MMYTVLTLWRRRQFKIVIIATQYDWSVYRPCTASTGVFFVIKAVIAGISYETTKKFKHLG